MEIDTRFRLIRQVVYLMHAHLVFVTSTDIRCSPTPIRAGRRRSCARCRENFNPKLVEFNGETNHVHLLVNFPPKVAISKLVNSLKGVFSRLLRTEL